MLHELTLQTMKDILEGGRVGAAFEMELKRVVMDCEDRPGDLKPRKVTIELVIEPYSDQSGVCENVWGRINVGSSVPKRKTKPISFGVRRGGMLVFNDLSESDVTQLTIE